MEHINSLLDKTQLSRLDSLPILHFVKNRWNIRPSLAVLAVCLILFLLSLVLNISPLLTGIVCYLIPAYLSFLALESTEKEDDIKYLTYWIIFSAAEVSTPLARLLLSKFIYMFFRIVLTIVLLHPATNFSVKIYNSFVRPFLAKHEKEIDQQIDDIGKKGKKVILEGVTEGIKKL
jgi:receptor expression-enhancing protein 5/6